MRHVPSTGASDLADGAVTRRTVRAIPTRSILTNPYPIERYPIERYPIDRYDVTRSRPARLAR